MHARDCKTVATFQMPGTLSSLDKKYQWLPCTQRMKMKGFVGTTLRPGNGKNDFL
jgi:hypothetical protein